MLQHKRRIEPVANGLTQKIHNKLSARELRFSGGEKGTNAFMKQDKTLTTDREIEDGNQDGISERFAAVQSDQLLEDWRGYITTFKGFTGTRPDIELKNASWDGIKKILCPDTPTVLSDKKHGQYFVPCELKDAPLVGKTLEAAQRNGEPTIGKMRSKSHVTEAALSLIDIDGLSEQEVMAGMVAIEADGLTTLRIHHIPMVAQKNLACESALLFL